MSTTLQKTFDLSRAEAAKMLKVSTRTLDRYIKSKKIASKSVAGRIMVSREELENMQKGRSHRKVTKSTTGSDKKSYAIKSVNLNEEAKVEEKVYQKLYEELRSEIKTFQQRLEGANYRVGQLETEVKSSVPLLDHQKLLTDNKRDKYNKKVLFIILGTVLALQPLWLLLAYY